MRHANLLKASSCLAVLVFAVCAAADAPASDRPAPRTAPTTRPANDTRDLRPDNVFVGVTPREPGRSFGPIVYYPFDYDPCGFYPDDYETYCDAGPRFGAYGIYPRSGYGYDCRAGYAYRLAAPRRLGYRPFYSMPIRARGNHGTAHRHR